MATIRIFNDIFDDKSRDFIYDTSKPLLEQIEEHLDKDYYKSTMVECYDPDTKKTFYAPMEDEDEKEGIILYANGESVTETYIPSENDIVHVVFVPLSGMSNAGWGALIGLGAGIALGLMTGGAGFTALFPALTWTAGNVAFATIAGGALGALIGWTIGDKIDQMQKAGGSINDKKTGEQLPDVRGCSNQSLLGNNFPFVIGKHLVTPFIIGDPYTEYSGERGEDAYIRELLCVGYGPLKLTDFKLGDFMLAYNRSHNNITKDTMIAGLLKGYSTGGVADNGDIVDYWSKNDVELEIIQQPDGAEIISIDPYFQDRTKIDLSQRPLVSSETMNAAGWDVPAGETCTVYSQGYSNQDESVTVLMTPINPDGTVLSPSELAEYADDCLVSGSQVNTVEVDYTVTYNPLPYNEPYVVSGLSLTINHAIQQVIELQSQFNGNWVTVLSLPAGAVTVSLSETERWPGTTCRLKIEEWTSAHFDINNSGSKNIELDEDVSVETHPYNLLATFVGSDSVQQSEDYAQALHENQEDYYFNRNSIGYGSIYTEVTKESVSDANIFFLSDKNLDEGTQVVYKGSSFPNQFRTNTVILSEACPRQFTINLDFPSGLYSTYTQTVNDETQTKYAKIPLWMCIQWRIYDSTKTSSDPKGTDYDDWNTIDFGTNVNKVFSTAEQEEDKARHKGNDFSHLSLDDLYQGFRGKTLQNFQYYSGEEGLSEFRVSATVTLTKEQCKQIMADTNPARIIEIRVLRVSPNYLNQVTNNSDTVGPYSYSDHVKVLTTVVKTFDMEALRNDDELKPVRVLSEKDLKKLCLVAIKAKADKAGYLQNNMESITCTAESFSPIWDSESKKILPEGTTEKITKVRKYYGYFEGNTDIKANRTDAAYERELTGPNAREQYEEARHEGKDWYMEKAGSNFPALIKNEVYDDPVLHNDTLCWYLPQSAEKFNNNSASSGALLVLFGEQSGPEAIGLEDLNIVAFSDWAEKSAAVNDGTTAPMAMDYNGHHYNKGDLIPVRYEANAYIYQGTKIEDMLQKLAFCGRAAWVIDEAGQVKFIMDAPVDYTKGAINAQNCISSSNSFNYEEPPAGLFITFHDENDGFENNSFYVWTDGNSAKRYHGSVEQLSMDYVTNNVQVTSLARYTLASRVQNKEILTRKIGPNGIIYSLGDVVLVQSDELLIGDVSGRIQEVIENNGTIYGFIMDSDYEYTAELDSNNVNSNQGVTIIQPSYMGKSNAVTLPLSSPRTQSVPLDYEQVYPVGTENPQAEGWYVKDGDEYVLTTDTTVVSGHVYYKAIMANYTLQKGLTNIVLFGKVIGDQYGIPRDTSEDYSAKTDVKYNFKTGDIAMMGLIEKISAPYRISKIKPEAGGKFTETLIPYDESFYNYGKALPTFQSYITPPQVTDAPVSLSEVPTTLKEQNDTLQNVYDAIGVIYDPLPPGLPSAISITASRDFISLAWVNTSDNVKHTVIELSKQNGEEGTWTQVAIIDSNNWRYNFNRNTDGYPEANSGTNKLSTWKFRLKNVSMCDVESAFTSAQSVTTTNYGTWVPATPTITLAEADRDGIDIAWSVDTNNRYGTPKYRVVVRYNDVDHAVNLNANLTARFDFNRNETRGQDAYPEASDFANWSIRVTNTNESDPTGITTTGSVSTTNYGTWVPATPNFVSKIPNEGGITFNWNAATGSGGKTLYGTPKYTVTVKYADSDHSVAETTKATLITNTVSTIYNFTRTGTGADGYPEATATADYYGLNKYTFQLKVENESGQHNETNFVSFTNDEIGKYGTWIPAAPTKKSIEAEETGIAVEWNSVSGNGGKTLYGGVTYKAYVYYDNSGTTETHGTLLSDGLSAFYNFVRTGQNADGYPEQNVDGYPEKSTVIGNYPKLDDYSVKFEAISTITNRSSGLGTAQTVGEDNYLTWIPVTPTNILGIAEENGIDFTWDDTSVCYGTNHYTLSLPDAQGTIPQTIDAKQFFYNFLRSDNGVLKDGYPEASDLAAWDFVITAVNTQTGRSTASSTQYVNSLTYLGWLPNSPVIATRSSGRACTLSMVNRELRYGKIRYKIMVCRPDQDYDEQGGERTYKYYLPVPTSNPFGDEDNYKANAEATPPVTPVLNTPITADSVYTQTMPLIDQNSTVYKKYSFLNSTDPYDYDNGTQKLLVYTDTEPPASATEQDVYIDGVLVEDALCWTDSTTNLNYISFEVSMPSPKDTVFWWSVAAYNDTTESLQSKTSAYVTEQDGLKVLTNAFATSAYDVVKAGITENALAPDAVTTDKIAAGTITANKIFVESLAAISANLGKITDGSLVGNQNNYWYLTDEYEGGQLVHRAGDFRVGGSSGTDYIACTTSDGTNYHVEIHASQFNITAIGTVVKGAFYVSPSFATIDPNTGIPSSYYARIDSDGVNVSGRLKAQFVNITQEFELKHYNDVELTNGAGVRIGTSVSSNPYPFIDFFDIRPSYGVIYGSGYIKYETDRTNALAKFKLEGDGSHTTKSQLDLDNLNVNGTFSITDATNRLNATNALISSLPDWTADPTDTTKLIRQDTDGSASFGKVTFLTVWNYIKSKIQNVGSLIIGVASTVGTKLKLKGQTYETNTYADNNPKIVFENTDASQNVSLTFTDYDAVQSPASLTLNGNQGGEYFIAPNVKTSGNIRGRLGYVYATKEAGAVSYWKIKINSTVNWMLCFVITVYQNYRAIKIMVSGYNYHNTATNQWHDPRAIIISDNGGSAVDVVFGYDSNANLWVGLAGNNYGSVTISDVVNGYDQITDYGDLFTISKVSSYGGTTQATVRATTPSSGCATCTTAAGTAAKVAIMPNFTLQSGVSFLITFTTTNTSASALTLNVNGTGAKSIYINGAASGTSNYTLPAGTYLCQYFSDKYYLENASGWGATWARKSGSADTASTATWVKGGTMRPANSNLYPKSDNGSLTHFLATSSMTTGKPMADGHIIHMSWDNAGGWGAQLYIPDDVTGTNIPQYRGENGGTWSAWKNFITEQNISSQSVNYATSAGSATSAGKWTTARNISISDADGTNTGTAVSVDGSAAKTLKLPSTIKASLSGTASNASSLINIPVVVPPEGVTSYNYTDPHWTYVVKAKLTTTGGYVIYHNGFRILWGIHTNTGGNVTQYVTFSSAVGTSFTQPPIINANYRKPDGSSDFYYAINIYEVSKTGFRMGSNSSFNNNLKFFWMAMGY